jgi:hypothetical protein
MLAGIINTAVAVLSLLIYKVIEKARELKEKLFEPEPVHNPTPTVLPVDQKRENEVTQEKAGADSNGHSANRAS